MPPDRGLRFRHVLYAFSASAGVPSMLRAVPSSALRMMGGEYTLPSLRLSSARRPEGNVPGTGDASRPLTAFREVDHGVRPLQVRLGGRAALVVARLVRGDGNTTAERLPEDVILVQFLLPQHLSAAQRAERMPGGKWISHEPSIGPAEVPRRRCVVGMPQCRAHNETSALRLPILSCSP